MFSRISEVGPKLVSSTPRLSFWTVWFRHSHVQEQQLDAELKKYRGHTFAQSTAATYKSQLRAYFRFCLYFGYRPVPCSHHFLRYVVFSDRTLAASNIPCYLNVVRIVHLQCGFPNPLQELLFKFQKNLLIRGIKRLHGDFGHQKLPITPDILHKLHGNLDLTNSMDATFGLPVSSPSSHSFESLIYLSLYFSS